MIVNKKLCEWILRVGVFGTFLGHGMLAFGIKQSWIPLITTFGFSKESAMALMPVIGIVDIIISFLVIIYPMRLILVWCTFWAFLAALSRPLSGEPIFEFVERFAGWATPLALLLIQGLPKSLKDSILVRNTH